MRLRAFNPSTDNLEKTYLSNAYPAGVVSVVVKNNNGITNQDRIMIGEMGRERTEIVTVGAAAPAADGVTVPLAAGTKFPHSADDPIYVLRYDQIKFYKSTTGVGGAYSLATTVPLDVDNADLETYYDDDTGLTSYFYEVTYFHSIKAIESSFSDPMPGSGYDRTMVGHLVNEFLTEVNDLQQKYITVPEILGLLNECNDDLLTQSRRPYRFLRKSWTLSTTAGNNRIPLTGLTPDIWKIDYEQYTYNLAGFQRTDRKTIITLDEMDYVSWNKNAQNDDNLEFIAIDKTTNELVLFPTPLNSQANVIKIYGWGKFNEIKGMGDILQTPNPRVYKLFLKAEYYLARATSENAYLQQADRWASKYNTEVVKLQRANKLDIGKPMAMLPDTRHARGLRR